jgi:hypothetical protein
MDAERFDSWTRTLSEAASRRAAMRTLIGGGLAVARGWFGHDTVAAQDVGTTSCRERLGNCDRSDQCCEAEEGHRIGCARVSEECRRPQDFPGERCCGRRGAVCSDSCACCRGYVCRDRRCVSVERGCLENVCCGCYRCDAGGSCELTRCLTAGTFRECIERCPNADAIDGVSGPGTTFTCGASGRCRVVCEDRRSAGQRPTVERWEAPSR